MTKRLLVLWGALSLFLSMAQAALAVPPNPFSPYGIVKVNGANVAPNTSINASCGGQVYGQTTQITLYNGDTWYSNLDIVGDDPDTPAKDGCYSNETVTFAIAGHVADQTAPWVGTSYQLDLTASIGPACFYADVEPNADHSNPALCDGDVDIADIARVAGCWNQLPGPPACPAGLDVDGTGLIDVMDLTVVAIEWPWPD